MARIKKTDQAVHHLKFPPEILLIYQAISQESLALFEGQCVAMLYFASLLQRASAAIREFSILTTISPTRLKHFLTDDANMRGKQDYFLRVGVNREYLLRIQCLHPNVRNLTTLEELSKVVVQMNAFNVQTMSWGANTLYDPLKMRTKKPRLIRSVLPEARMVRNSAVDTLTAVRLYTELSEFGFNLSGKLAGAIVSGKQHLEQVTRKYKLLSQLDRILLSSNPALGFEGLIQLGLLSYVVHELDEWIGGSPTKKAHIYKICEDIQRLPLEDAFSYRKFRLGYLLSVLDVREISNALKFFGLTRDQRDDVIQCAAEYNAGHRLVTPFVVTK